VTCGLRQRGERCQAASSERASRSDEKVLDQATLHGRPRRVLLAPPRIQPLWARRRRAKLVVIPTYVDFLSAESKQ